ncbi:MAG: prepilin-type N-terminal cleavage/methylation domain-containing protein [Planctomycetota bacterium]
MQATARRTSGFTLIELLVVVSIIALLISLLLPALSGVRDKANEQADLSDLRQHAVGGASYSSTNRDRLLNAPPAPAGDPLVAGLLGTQGSPAIAIAYQDLFPTNGWAFPQGMNTFLQFNDSSGGYNSNLSDAQLWDFYIPVLGEFMVEGEGMQMLQDVYISATDRGSADGWEAWQDSVRENSGQLPSIVNGGDDDADMFNVGSYRYSLTGMLSPRCFQVNDSNDAFLSLEDAFSDRNLATQYITYNSAANVSFPDLKVMFFGFADLSDRVAWNSLVTTSGSLNFGSSEPPGVVKVAAASQDGSAKAVVQDDVARADAEQSAGYIREVGIDLPFLLTHGGIKGRDLR